jgi:hypothetical protein
LGAEWIRNEITHEEAAKVGTMLLPHCHTFSMPAYFYAFHIKGDRVMQDTIAYFHTRHIFFQ